MAVKSKSKNLKKSTRTRLSRLTNYIRLWFKNWNRVIAAVVAIMIFMALFIFVLVHILTNLDKPNEPLANKTISALFGIKEDVFPISFNDSMTQTSICTVEDCVVVCLDGNDYTTFLNDLLSLKLHNICPDIKLSLININLHDNIKEGWLKSLEAKVRILTLQSANLIDFGSKSFSGDPFNQLYQLEITDSSISYLRKDMFTGATIVDFSFRYNNIGRSVKVEGNVFGDIANTLTNLQFSNSINNPETLLNITGISAEFLPRLTIYDLSSNTINTLPKSAFVATKILTSLYLDSSAIRTIEASAFSGLNMLQLLDLDLNNLQILPEKVFDGFASNVKITIDKNNFICNCSMVWFKQYFKIHAYDYFKNTKFLCSDYDNKDFSLVDFCPGSTTEDDNITVTAPTSTANPDDSKVVKIICEKSFSNDIWYDYKEFSHYDKVSGSSLSFYRLFYDDKISYQIMLENSENYKYYHLLYSSNQQMSFRCVTDLSETIILHNLSYGTSYTTCFLQNGFTKVKRTDCLSFTVPLYWKDQAFLKNKDIPIITSSVLLGSILLAALTSVAVFYTIRQNPKLIKGNKRVIIVKKTGFDALLMPRSKEENVGNFLTRKFKKKSKVTDDVYSPPLPPNHP